MKKIMKKLALSVAVLTFLGSVMPVDMPFTGHVAVAQAESTPTMKPIETIQPTETQAPPTYTAQPTGTEVPPTDTSNPYPTYPIGWACFYGTSVYNKCIPGDLCLSCTIEVARGYDIYVDNKMLTRGEEYGSMSSRDYIVLKESFLKNLSTGYHSVNLVFFDNIRYVPVSTSIYVLSQKPTGKIVKKEGETEKSCFATTGGVFIKDFDNGLYLASELELNISSVYLNNHKLKTSKYWWNKEMLGINSKYLNTLKPGTYYIKVHDGNKTELLTLLILSKDVAGSSENIPVMTQNPSPQPAAN